MNIKHYLEHPSDLFWRIIRPVCPDKIWIQHKYKSVFHKPINFKNPRTFNEKLNYLKLYDRNPLYTTLVDKYAVKNWVAERIGKEHIIPTLGVYDTFDEIDFSELPQQFVLKCTHDSGGLAIVTDKDAFLQDDETGGQKGITSARKKINESLKRNFYLYGREWPYKNVKPRIIAEKYMVDESGTELKDYKVHNFGGEPKLIEVDYGRFTEHKRNLYGTDWSFVDAQIQYQNDRNHAIDKPKAFEKMLECAKALSDGIPYVRTDFYCIDGNVLFGEMTFYHGSGYEKFVPEDFEKKLGSLIDLPTDIKTLEIHGGGYVCIANCFILWLHNAPPIPEKGLTDYKLMCFNGKAKLLEVHRDRFSDHHTQDFYYCGKGKWEKTSISQTNGGTPPVGYEIEKPAFLDDMIYKSELLAKDMPFVRVDWYYSGQLYFGELTFYDSSGFEPFDKPDDDVLLGSWIELPEKTGRD